MRRLGDDLRAARMLLEAGASPLSVILYPLRRRLPPRQSRLDLRDGTSIAAPPDEPLLFLFREIWVDRSYDPSGEIGAGAAAIVDIGAHVGVFSVWAATRCPGARIVAVEASLRAARYLRANVARNRLGRVTVIEAACGGSRRRARLHRRGPEMMSSLYAGVDGVEVDVITLADVLEQGNVEQCDLLKLDCEGAEYEIVLGASADTLRRVRRIVMECHRDGAATPADLERHLTVLGFDVARTPSPDGVHEYLFALRHGVPVMPLEVAVESPVGATPQ